MILSTGWFFPLASQPAAFSQGLLLDFFLLCRYGIANIVSHCCWHLMRAMNILYICNSFSLLFSFHFYTFLSNKKCAVFKSFRIKMLLQKRPAFEKISSSKKSAVILNQVRTKNCSSRKVHTIMAKCLTAL